MTIIKGPIFKLFTKNRLPIPFMREGPNAPFDLNSIVSYEFNHAMHEIMLFRGKDDATKQLHEMRIGSFSSMNLFNEYDLNYLALTMRLLDSFMCYSAI